MEKEWIALLQPQNQLVKVLETNQAAARFGLTLTKREATLIVEERKRALQEQRRVEFGEGIAPKLIYEFCDSDHIVPDNYADTIIRLQEIFYRYKNEMQDKLTDDELLHLMKEQFETVCFGDLEYLESTCLANFARAVRAGYEGYQASDGYGESSKFEEVTRWDSELYLESLAESFEGGNDGEI